MTILAVCPTCNVGLGQPCLTKSGKEAKSPHKGREVHNFTPVIIDSPRDAQRRIEDRLSYSSLMQKATQDIINSYETVPVDGAELIQTWLDDETHWEGKIARIDKLRTEDLEVLTKKIVSTLITQCVVPMKLVTLASMVAGMLPYEDRSDALQTAGELIAVLEGLNLWASFRNAEKSVVIETLIDVDPEIRKQLEFRFYLPPMIVKPSKLGSNSDCGYLTQHDTLILGGNQNFHTKNISLDVLNRLNSIEYAIDTEFLNTFEEEFHREELTYEEFKELSKAEKDLYRMDEKQWVVYREQCDAIYGHLVKHGNKFHFTHKVDKRGRVYSQGYHLNPQGKAYKKAMLNLAHKEICTGLEEWNNA